MPSKQWAQVGGQGNSIKVNPTPCTNTSLVDNHRTSVSIDKPPSPSLVDASGEWTVVTKRNKGKNIVEAVSSSPCPGAQAPLSLHSAGNRFFALAPFDEVGSSSQRLEEDFPSPSRALNITSKAAVEVTEEEVDSELEEEVLAPKNSSSNRQRKREAKMNFSGNRPKGRHKC